MIHRAKYSSVETLLIGFEDARENKSDSLTKNYSLHHRRFFGFQDVIR